MNKYYKAFSKIKNHKIVNDNDFWGGPYIKLYDELPKELDTIKELVDKETPKEVFKESLADALCPICHYYISFDMLNDDFKYAPKYCHHCGQALDWSDNNEKDNL